jgi:hypothetical protein
MVTERLIRKAVARAGSRRSRAPTPRVTEHV